LPLTHTTDAFDLRDIVADQKIQPRYCTVFDEDLSYHFYGRPAYRKNAETQANGLAAYAPVILIFKPAIADNAIAAFPFDSGAYVGERYSDVMHHRMSVKDFGLEPSFEKIENLLHFTSATTNATTTKFHCQENASAIVSLKLKASRSW